MIDWIKKPENRLKVYKVCRALAPVLVVAGVVSNGQVEAVLSVVGAVLLFGTNHVAIKNVQ